MYLYGLCGLNDNKDNVNLIRFVKLVMWKQADSVLQENIEKKIQ